MGIVKGLTRRNIIRSGLVGGAGLAAAAALAGCGETTVITETKIEEVIKEVPVEKIVTQIVEKEIIVEKIVTQIVEKEVLVVQEKIVTVTADGAPAAPKVVTLDFWTPGGSAKYCEMFEVTMAEYSAVRQGSIKFDSISCGVGDESFREVLLARIAAGNPPDVTIYWDSPVTLAARGAVERMDEWMKTSRNSQLENWPEGLMPSVTWEGKIYGLAVAAGTYAVMYNQELFDAAGVDSDPEAFPATFDAFKEATLKLTKYEGDKPVQLGFNLGSISEYDLAIWSASNGSQLFDAANAKYTIDANENVYLMDWMVGIINDAFKGDLTAVNEARNWGTYGDDAKPPGFQNGATAMTYVGAWVLGDMYNVADVNIDRWSLGAAPVGPSGSGHKSGFWPNWLIVPKGSKDPEEAMNWIDYLGMEGMPRWNATVPDLPTNRLVPRELIKAAQVQEYKGRVFGEWVIDFFYEMLELSTAMWDSPVQGFATDQIGRALERITIGGEDVADELAQAQGASQEQLEKVLN